VTVTAAGHGLAAGDVVTINDTTNYTGIYYVESISGNDFNITEAWNGDDAQGYVQRSGTLTCGAGSDGDYSLNLSGNLSHDGNDDTFVFCILHNLTPITKMAFETRDANGDAVWPISISGIIESVAEGDKIGFIHNGGSGAGLQISLSNINMSVTQIGT